MGGGDTGANPRAVFVSSPERQNQQGEKAQGLVWERPPTMIDCKPPLQNRKSEEWGWME